MLDQFPAVLLAAVICYEIVKTTKDRINEHMENACKKKVNRYYLTIFYSGIRK